MTTASTTAVNPLVRQETARRRWMCLSGGRLAGTRGLVGTRTGGFSGDGPGAGRDTAGMAGSVGCSAGGIGEGWDVAAGSIVKGARQREQNLVPVQFICPQLGQGRGRRGVDLPSVSDAAGRAGRTAGVKILNSSSDLESGCSLSCSELGNEMSSVIALRWLCL